MTVVSLAPVSDAAPDYTCAVLTDPDGWYLFEQRPAHAQYAAGALTCFGGRREGDETAIACLRRELQEELGWVPATPQPLIDLVAPDRIIARFYRAEAPHGLECREPGRQLIRVAATAWREAALSPWHRLVMEYVAK